MRKLFLTMAVIAGAMFFASCDEETVNEIITEFTGKAAVALDDGSGNPQDVTFSASMAMTKEDADKATPYTIGLSMNMSIQDLLNITDTNSIVFPMMAYRLTGSVAEGQTLTVQNYLTTEDVLTFDYRSLFNGKFAGSQLVGVALNATKYYVMKSGTIAITEVTPNKISGSFSGTAYIIDRTASPMMDVNQSVPFSGSFNSRFTTMINWILNMQSEGTGND